VMPLRRWILALFLVIFNASAQQIYDLLLKNGRVMDPANHRDSRLDVAVIGNRIVRVASELPAAHARVVVDVGSYLVTPGLIDAHMQFLSDLRPDYHTLPYGVTTAVDAGSATCETFADFKKNVIDHAKVRLLEFLAAPDHGCTSRVVSENRDTIAGVAATAASLDAALAAAGTGSTVVMAPAELSSRLRQGDIGCQIYRRGSPLWVSARNRGVLFDSSVGSDGLRFRIAQPAVAQKVLPDTISSGLDSASALLPRANLAASMSIFLNLGLTPEQIIERVTSNAARALKRPELGNLTEGNVADIAVLEVQEGKFGFLDAGHARLEGTGRFHCVMTVRNGMIVWDSEGLSLPDATKVGPYTNFK